METLGVALLGVYALAGVLLLPFAWVFYRQEIRASETMASIAVLTFVSSELYVLSMFASDVRPTLFWLYLYLAVLGANVLLFLVFALTWSNRREYVHRPTFAVLGVVLFGVPLLGLVGLAVPSLDVQPLLWANPGVTTIGGLTIYDSTPGPLAGAWNVVAAVSVLVVLGLLAEFTLRPEQRLYRKQNGLLVGGALVLVLIGVARQLLGIPIETTPVSHLLFAAILTVAIVGFGHFDVVPLAKNSIIEEIDVGVLVYDTDGQFLDANRTALSVLGLDDAAGSDIGTVLAETPVPVDASETDTDLATLERRLDGTEFSAVVDGRQRHYSMSVSPVHGSDGSPVGGSLLLYDVTEQYRRERQLQETNERLDRFAGVVSHDLRNPIQVAHGHLELARNGREDSFDKIEQSLTRMEHIVDDVLTLAREGESIDDPEPVELAAVSRDAWNHVATDGGTLSVADDATVIADRDRLVQLLENLFRNAVEHGSTGSRTAADDAVEHGSTGSQKSEMSDDTVEQEAAGLTVTVGCFDGGFYVADDGPGIPADERDAVFEDGYTTGGGTGLGLTIVSEIADGHDWEVGVTESNDGGVRFEFAGVQRVD